MESLVLSFAGGAAGIGLALAMTRGLLALVPSEGNLLLLRAEPDSRILLFALGLTFLTSLIFGLVPALRASRPDVWTTLKDAVGSIAGRGGSLLLRKGLVTAQVALSFLLLFGAGLFVKSLQNLKAADTGFRDLDNLITFQLSPALNGYDAPRTVHFYQELLDRIRAIPGVRSAALALSACAARLGMGQHHIGGGPSGQRRRRHAGVHEFALAGLLRDHGHSDSARTGLRPA